MINAELERIKIKNDTQKLIDSLIDRFYYRPLPEGLSEQARNTYKKRIPDLFKIKPIGDMYLVDLKTYQEIALGYERIVIGDYGAFVEIKDEDILKRNIIIKPGEEKRFTKQYSNCKYYWYCPTSNLETKLYKQRRKVGYADYKVGYWYVSVFDVDIVER